MSPLPSDDRRALLALARRAIVEAVHHRPLPEASLTSPDLARPCGAFVSLHQRGRLRGCIGQIEAADPLALHHRGAHPARERSRLRTARQRQLAVELVARSREKRQGAPAVLSRGPATVFKTFLLRCLPE